MDDINGPLQQRLLSGQLAMHAVANPERIALMAANRGLAPPAMPAPAQLPAPIQQQAQATPLEQPNGPQPVVPPADVHPNSPDRTKDDAVAPVEKGIDWKSKLSAASKVLGAVAPPQQPNPPPEMHAPAPQGGASYNPDAVIAFIQALMQGGGSPSSPPAAPSLGALIGRQS